MKCLRPFSHSKRWKQVRALHKENRLSDQAVRGSLPAGLLDGVGESLRDIFGSKLNNAYLYGSYARGDFDDESDVDVAVVLDMPRSSIARFRNDVVSLMSAVAMEHDQLVNIAEIPLADFSKYKDDLPYYRNIAQEGGLPLAAGKTL